MHVTYNNAVSVILTSSHTPSEAEDGISSGFVRWVRDVSDGSSKYTNATA